MTHLFPWIGGAGRIIKGSVSTIHFEEYLLAPACSDSRHRPRPTGLIGYTLTEQVIELVNLFLLLLRLAPHIST